MSELIFISVSNYGAIDLTKNHLAHFKQNNLTNYMAYVTDDESYEELTRTGFNTTKIDTVISKNKMNFGNEDHNYMTYVRYFVILELLNQGKIVWYLDVDTVALVDLNIIYDTLDKTKDIYFQNDINMLCTGCMLIFPINKNIELINIIIKNKNDKMNDQLIMNFVLMSDEKTFDVGVLSEYNFPNGLLYFNELSDNSDYREVQLKFKNSLEPVYFIHANYMVGVDTKINAFKEKQLWII